MDPYTQADIDALIACPKTISDPPKKDMRLDRGSRRNSMRLVATRDKEVLEFEVFMRINDRFPENFSIGLRFTPRDGRANIVLLRCNGPHGEFASRLGQPATHFQFHVHPARASNIEAGARAEKDGEPTDAYGSYSQALHHFLRAVHVINASQYFPQALQLEMNFDVDQANNGLPGAPQGPVQQPDLPA
jgi:hypothetical protein